MRLSFHGRWIEDQFQLQIIYNDILKTVVWTLSSNCTKSYLRDMSQQVISLLYLGPIIVAQKRGGGSEIQASDA